MALPRALRPLGIGWWASLLGMLALTAGVLHLEGRRWWCACGQPWIWVSDAWGSHNSQHPLDPYSFTHVLHGVILCGLLALVLPRVALAWRLWLTLAAEALWEVVENSAFIIDRYRAATAAVGYEGDALVNSLGDILSGGLGFLIAWRLGLRWSVLFFIILEVILCFWIKDNLTLNIIMLLYPNQAIRDWQTGH